VAPTGSAVGPLAALRRHRRRGSGSSGQRGDPLRAAL